ncbi:unnamed protein product [Camellia sinensis]
MLPSQAAQLNLQSQLLASPGQKTGFVQGSQFHPGSSPGQPLQGMQGMGMGSLNLSSQIRANGSLAYAPQQRINQVQMRQQLSQQNPLSASQKLQAQSQLRTSFINPQLSGLTQNGQAGLMQGSLSQQQWLKQMSALSTNIYVIEPTAVLPTCTAASINFAPTAPSAATAASASAAAAATATPATAPPPPTATAFESAAVSQDGSASWPKVSKFDRIAARCYSIWDNYSRGEFKPRNRGKQSTSWEEKDTGFGFTDVDPRGKLDPEVEDLLLEIADDFIDSVTTFACSLAKHRNSSIVEAKDVLLHLEKNLHLTIPGFSSEERKNQQNHMKEVGSIKKKWSHFNERNIREPGLGDHIGPLECSLSTPDVKSSTDLHKKRLDMIHSVTEPSQSETNVNNGKEVARQGLINPVGTNHLIRPSPSSDQLDSQSNASQMLQQQITRCWAIVNILSC